MKNWKSRDEWRKRVQYRKRRKNILLKDNEYSKWPYTSEIIYLNLFQNSIEFVYRIILLRGFHRFKLPWLQFFHYRDEHKILITIKWSTMHYITNSLFIRSIECPYTTVFWCVIFRWLLYCVLIFHWSQIRRLHSTFGKRNKRVWTL